MANRDPTLTVDTNDIFCGYVRAGGESQKKERGHADFAASHSTHRWKQDSAENEQQEVLLLNLNNLGGKTMRVMDASAMTVIGALVVSEMRRDESLQTRFSSVLDFVMRCRQGNSYFPQRRSWPVTGTCPITTNQDLGIASFPFQT